MWDAYVHADLVSYPSTWEGFGNQFLEAVFAKKPIILFEHPVFRADMKKGGYRYISLGSQNVIDQQAWASIPKNNLEKAAAATIEMLIHPLTNQDLEYNYQRAKADFGENKLKELLEKCLA